VDDEVFIIKIEQFLLENLGYRITATTSSMEALRLFEQQPADFDLVITDIMMAQMDGWELLDTIRKEMKLDELALPVIIISAFESDILEAKALGKGANGSFVKGNDPLSKLLRQVKIQTGHERSRYSDTTD